MIGVSGVKKSLSIPHLPSRLVKQLIVEISYCSYKAHVRVSHTMYVRHGLNLHPLELCARALRGRICAVPAHRRARTGVGVARTEACHGESSPVISPVEKFGVQLWIPCEWRRYPCEVRR